MHKQNKSVVALKRILLHNEKQDGFPITSLREISVLRRCNHVNIVNLLDVVVGRKRDGIFLVFEYCEHDLSSLLKFVNKPFIESEVKCLMIQLLSALNYLHENFIIHRDIKLSNLLYDNQGMLFLLNVKYVYCITVILFRCCVFSVCMYIRAYLLCLIPILYICIYVAHRYPILYIAHINIIITYLNSCIVYQYIHIHIYTFLFTPIYIYR